MTWPSDTLLGLGFYPFCAGLIERVGFYSVCFWGSSLYVETER